MPKPSSCLSVGAAALAAALLLVSPGSAQQQGAPAVGAAPGAAPAARPAPPPLTPAPIGYVELDDDARYDLTNAYANISWRTFGRPYPAAVTAIQEAQQTGKLIRLDFELEKYTGTKAQDIA